MLEERCTLYIHRVAKLPRRLADPASHDVRYGRAPHFTLGKTPTMPLQLTMCHLCARSRPEFLRAINQLVAFYPNEIELIELECMAACDDVPAIMIETDYHAQVAPQELIRLIREMLQMHT
jgi:hypothetical protein